MQEHDLLILGAGWTSTFLIPLLKARKLSFAATTRDGHKVAGESTIEWTFDPDGDEDQFGSLPLAKAVLITFPLNGKGQSKLLVNGYNSTIANKLSRKDAVRFIQLGSTGIWQIPQPTHWVTRHSPYNKENTRAFAEDELIELGGCSLNLAGLWGGPRDPKNWAGRVAKSKDDVQGKKSLHMIHGQDVARAILAIIGDKQTWDKHAKGQRWMLTDGFVYDWWSLFAGWADVPQEGEKDEDRKVDREPSNFAQWVYELMVEEDKLALPRSMETLGRCYDSREFWQTFGLAPLKARI